jgi:hypothetical protein
MLVDVSTLRVISLGSLTAGLHLSEDILSVRVPKIIIKNIETNI